MGNTGFSLVETNLAILLVGVGLLALFSLFPLALQQSDLAVRDTQQAMFADCVLSAIEGSASDIEEWADWSSPTEWLSMLEEGITNIFDQRVITEDSFVAGKPNLNFPAGSPHYVTYTVSNGPVPNRRGKVRRTRLQVASGRNQDVSLGRTYYTESMFLGE